MNEVGKFVMRDLKHIDINYAWNLEKRVKELCSYIYKAYGYRIKLNDYNGEDTIEFDFIPSHIELQGRCAETHDETSVIPIINCGQIYHVSYESFLWIIIMKKKMEVVKMSYTIEEAIELDNKGIININDYVYCVVTNKVYLEKEVC